AARYWSFQSFPSLLFRAAGLERGLCAVVGNGLSRRFLLRKYHGRCLRPRSAGLTFACLFPSAWCRRSAPCAHSAARRSTRLNFNSLIASASISTTVFTRVACRLIRAGPAVENAKAPAVVVSQEERPIGHTGKIQFDVA